jgi:putative pre-16S rRNA nuclease
VRVLAIDLGTKRIGVAASDATATLASPRGVVHRRGDRAAEHAELAAIVADEEATLVLIGLPRNMDGSEGMSARSAQEEAAALGAVLGVPVELVDERLTTVSADRALSGRGLRAPARRRVVDQTAAAIMLQAWLDGAPGEGWRRDARGSASERHGGGGDGSVA